MLELSEKDLKITMIIMLHNLVEMWATYMKEQEIPAERWKVHVSQMEILETNNNETSQYQT